MLSKISIRQIPTPTPHRQPPRIPLRLKGDSRDIKAVTRLVSALSKRLLLNPDHADYVFKPTKDSRTRVRSQLIKLNAQEFFKPMDVSFFK